MQLDRAAIAIVRDVAEHGLLGRVGTTPVSDTTLPLPTTLRVATTGHVARMHSLHYILSIVDV